jgi:hypothetical protein
MLASMLPLAGGVLCTAIGFALVLGTLVVHFLGTAPPPQPNLVPASASLARVRNVAPLTSAGDERYQPKTL